MARPKLQRPTDAEIEILSVLWERGPSTVREVFDEIAKTRATGYTSVLKLMQIMAGKGLVERDEVGRVHVYRPTIAQEATQSALVTDLVERVFNGSAAKLIMHALAGKKASAEERAIIERMLQEYEGDRK